MNILTIIAVLFVIFLHIFFLILEMFLWKKPIGMKIFGLQADFAQKSASLAANQGLYNGFLSAGLTWGLLSPPCETQILTFFLILVIIAGIFGGLTVNRKILWIQSFPALIALAFLSFLS